MTALREANQVGALQPTTLVAYEAEIENIFDCRDEAGLAAEGMNAAALADSTWREQMKAGGKAKTQTFAMRLIAAGYNGLLVRSFVAGSAPQDMNLVLWRWGDSPPTRLVPIDDENRLSL